MKEFGDILKRWERQASADPRSGEDAARRRFEEYLLANPPTPDQSERDAVYDDRGNRANGRRAFRNMPWQDTIDLHGLTAAEAVREVSRFLERSCAAGLRKVLVIHGKGKHSPGRGVLRDEVISFLQKSARAGEIGHPSEKDGGRGATWVVLRPAPRQRSR